jgi:hypothetical protein
MDIARMRDEKCGGILIAARAKGDRRFQAHDGQCRALRAEQHRLAINDKIEMRRLGAGSALLHGHHSIPHFTTGPAMSANARDAKGQSERISIAVMRAPVPNSNTMHCRIEIPQSRKNLLSGSLHFWLNAPGVVWGRQQNGNYNSLPVASLAGLCWFETENNRINALANGAQGVTDEQKLIWCDLPSNAPVRDRRGSYARQGRQGGIPAHSLNYLVYRAQHAYS